MFYCQKHQWGSDKKPCPACEGKIIVTPITQEKARQIVDSEMFEGCPSHRNEIDIRLQARNEAFEEAADLADEQAYGNIAEAIREKIKP